MPSEIAELREALIRAVMDQLQCGEKAACEKLTDYFALLAA